MTFKLHHFGLACPDLDRAASWYGTTLAGQRTCTWHSPGADIAFVGRGGDVTIELVGPPFGPYGPHRVERPGAASNHLAFEVDDLERAFDRLSRARVARASITSASSPTTSPRRMRAIRRAGSAGWSTTPRRSPCSAGCPRSPPASRCCRSRTRRTVRRPTTPGPPPATRSPAIRSPTSSTPRARPARPRGS